MNEERTNELREHELERMTAQYLYLRREREKDEELARIRELPFEKLPCGEEEKRELYEFAKERLTELEEEIPLFREFCEGLRGTVWPQNLCHSLFQSPLLLKEGAEAAVLTALSRISPAERQCLLGLYREQKTCDELCEELGIYITELDEHVCFGLRRLRHPRHSQRIGDQIVFLSPQTPLSEIAAVCASEEELLSALREAESAEPAVPPESLRKAAQELLEGHEGEVTTAFLQRNLKISYPQAAALKEMLREEP